MDAAAAKVIFGLVVLEGAAMALAPAGQTPVGIVFGAIVMVNAVLMLIWGAIGHQWVRAKLSV
jgi:hypothetical protein